MKLSCKNRFEKVSLFSFFFTDNYLHLYLTWPCSIPTDDYTPAYRHNGTPSGSAENPIIVVPKKLFNKAKKHVGFLPPKRKGTSPGDMLSGDTPDDCVSTTPPAKRTASRVSLFACIVTRAKSSLCRASSLVSMTPFSRPSILSSRSLACLWLNSYNVS